MGPTNCNLTLSVLREEPKEPPTRGLGMKILSLSELAISGGRTETGTKV